KLSILSLVETTADAPGIPRLLPDDGSRVTIARRAADLGINRGGKAKPGVGQDYAYRECCTLSYDLETSTEDSQHAGFPLSSARILSIAALCTCGFEFFVEGVQQVLTSSEMVERFIESIAEHNPDWLIGW